RELLIRREKTHVDESPDRTQITPVATSTAKPCQFATSALLELLHAIHTNFSKSRWYFFARSRNRRPAPAARYSTMSGRFFTGAFSALDRRTASGSANDMRTNSPSWIAS